jgi:hypothetical protein
MMLDGEIFHNSLNLRTLEICIHPSLSNIGGLVSPYIYIYIYIYIRT